MDQTLMEMNAAGITLDPGEREVWRGSPVQGPVLTPLSRLFKLLSLGGIAGIAVLGFIAFRVLRSSQMWETSGGKMTLLILGLIAGINFIQVLLYLNAPRIARWHLPGLEYRITDRRVLIIRHKKGKTPQTTSIPLENVTALSAKATAAGYGYVELTKPEKSNGLPFLFQLPPTALYNVSDPESVMEIIRRQQTAGR